jgi:phosphatidylinositol dimannoside acyltransferase
MYRIASTLVPRVPPRVGYALCDLFGTVAGPCLPAYHDLRANMRVLLPHANEADRDRAARRVIAGICKNYFDLFRFPALSQTELDRIIQVSGGEHLQRALERGRGALLVAPHCGPYTISFAPLTQRFNTRLLLVVEQMVDPQVHDLINRARAMPGVDVEPLSPAIGRTILRALRRNDVVLLAGDRAIARSNIPVQFFGRPTPLPSGPATLALRTGAPLLPSFMQRLPDNRTAVWIDPPLKLEPGDDTDRDIRDVTQKIAYIMQAYIKRDPGQWLVAERVWDGEGLEARG